MKAPDHRRLSPIRAFTLIELLVSMLIVTVIAMLLMMMTDSTLKILKRTTTRTVQFQSARSAFEAMTRRISQATLNTYLDYDDATAPKLYLRQSELRFIAGKTGDLLNDPNAAKWPGHGVFFQAPLGHVNDSVNERLNNLLNTWGYFVEFGDDRPSRPPFFDTISNAPSPAYRYRLMELMEPTESMGIYFYTSGLVKVGNSMKPKNLSYMGREWFSTAVMMAPSTQPQRPVRVIAENILALVILPKLTTGEDPTGAKLSPKYEFDSSKTDIQNSPTVDPRYNWKHQLPPVVQVTMIAADEVSYDRFQTGSDPVDLLGSRFATVGNLAAPATNNYSKDIESLETELRDKYRLNVRVFSTDVAIRAAKWSRDQAN